MIPVKGKGATAPSRNTFHRITKQMTKNQASTMELPGLLAEVEDVVGRDAAIKLAIACGGTRIYMPAAVDAEHWLAEAIGVDAAIKLAAHFSYGRRGIRLDMPMMPRALQVHTLTEAGASAREIALKLGIHQRTVHANRRHYRAGHKK